MRFYVFPPCRDAWYDSDYYWSRQTRGDEADTTTTGKPVRRIQKVND